MSQKLYIKNPRTGQIEDYDQKGMIQSYFVDGSVSMDVPTKRLAELFNVNTFILSQVNPHGVPFMWKLTGKDNFNIMQRLQLNLKKTVYDML